MLENSFSYINEKFLLPVSSHKSHKNSPVLNGLEPMTVGISVQEATAKISPMLKTFV